MISKGFKLYKEGHLVNKMNSIDPKDWIVKKPTFSYVKFIEKKLTATKDIPIRALFRCKQTGELANLKCKVA